MKRLTWRRESREKGLAGTCQGERGYNLMCDGREVGYVRPLFKGGKFSPRVGYYWYCDGHNSLWETPKGVYATIEEAKEVCREYVRQKMNAEKGITP